MQERNSHQLGSKALNAVKLLIVESMPANKNLISRIVINLLTTSAEWEFGLNSE